VILWQCQYFVVVFKLYGIRTARISADQPGRSLTERNYLVDFQVQFTTMRGNLSRILFPGPLQQWRRFSTEAPIPKKLEGPGEDPRPPWVYVGTRLISLVIIPGRQPSCKISAFLLILFQLIAVGVYSVFFYDFGERDHVFQPVRPNFLAFFPLLNNSFL